MDLSHILPLTGLERMATGKTSNCSSSKTPTSDIIEKSSSTEQQIETEDDCNNNKNKSNNNNPINVVAVPFNKMGSVVSLLTMQENSYRGFTNNNGRSKRAS